MFGALLDTSVLWPSLARDFLLTLAAEGLYRPLWSRAILAELNYHEARKLIDRGEQSAAAQARADWLIDQMSTAFADAMVEGWEPLEGSFGLPDPDDEHVVAAAVIGGAGAIVTENVRDFPAGKLPQHLDVLTASVFVHNTVDLDPAGALRAIRQLSSRHTRPPRSPAQLIDELETRYQMGMAAEILRSIL